MNGVAQLGALLSHGCPPHRVHKVNRRIEKSFAQDPLSEHASCAEEDDSHGFALLWIKR